MTKLLESDGDKKIVLDNLYSGIQVERASAKAVNYCKDISDVNILRFSSAVTIYKVY